MRPNPTVKVLLCLTAAAVLGVQFLFWSKLAFDVLRIAALCCAVLVYSLWNKREKLTFESGPLSTLAGAVLLGLLLYRSVSMPGTLFASLVPAARLGRSARLARVRVPRHPAVLGRNC